MNGLSRSLLSLSLVAALAAALSACAEEEKPRPNGELCGAPSQCVSNLCHSSTCLDPAADDDGDGLINEVEFALGTNATIPDSDGDGIPDYTEVVDPSAAADQDGDGTIDALESAHIDTDCNGLPDQYDPGGIEPDPLKPPETLCSDDIVAKFPDLAGLCCPDADEDGVEDLMDCDPNDEFVKVDTDCLTGTYLQDKCNNYACQKGFKCVPTSKCPAGDEPCSTNTCDEDTGECTFVPADQNCDDGNECTVDTCVNDQECLHLEVICTDGEPCTEDYCNPKEGCLYDPIEDGTLDCIDQTKQDQDGDGVLDAEDNCPLKPNTDQLNTDSDSQGDVCDDDDDNDSSPDADDCEPLNAEVYPGANEDCDGIDNNCNDQIDEGLCDDKPCHTGQCQPGPDQECTYEPVADGVECEDGSLCTSGDSCQGGQCTGVELSCAAEPCQQAACNPDTGVCEPLEPLADGSECNDGEGCTVEDVCKDGFCVGEAKVCDDGNECTEDWCDSATGSCQTLDSDDGVMCDLENPCSYESVCMGGSCEEWLPTSCDDGNPCTTEGECDPEAGGCVYAVSEDLCGFDEVCGELESCIADCAAVNTIGLTSDAYLNKGFVEQDGGTWFCDKNQGNDCVVNESAMPTSNGAFVFNISAKFPQDGTLRLKILNEIECALPDGTDATALFPVYQVLLTMDEGVADARIVRLLELSEFCGMQTQTTVIGEPGVPELPGPGAWFSYSVGVDADGSLDIALPDGGTWFHTKMDTPLSIQGPYSFQPKISGGTEISPLLLVPNVDSCCATDADCEGGDPCTEHSCIEGACVVQSEGCDDGDPCTKDICQAQGCSFVVINDESSVSDQKQGIDDGCQSLGCTPVVTSTSEEVTTYCTAICDTIDKCEEENLVIIGGGLDVPGGDVSCLDNCRDDLSENLLSASFWSCRSGLAEEEGLCGPPEEGEIAELCGTAECPPEVAPTCEGLCEELEGCGFSGLDEAPDEFAAIWGPGPLCAHSCTGFGLAGLATAVVKNCVTKVFEQEACDYETAGLCGSMGTCASICEEAFGDSAESPGCHVGTPLHAQLASFDECRGTCMDLPVNKRSRFMGCFQVSGCGPMASECTDPEADFGDVSVVCEQECTAAIEACGPLPYLPTVQSCKSWCEGAAVSSQGLDQSIDLAGALLAADCPTGVERLRVFFSELLEMVPACEEACATSAAVACYGPQGENGTYDESGCQQSCSNDYFTQSTGFIEDGSCGELIEECGDNSCACVESCTQDSPVLALCNESCSAQVEANLYGSFESCFDECSNGGPDALVRAACWATAPTSDLASVRCEEGYGVGEISQKCIDLCLPSFDAPSDICSDWGGYSCALVCEGARRWVAPDASSEMIDCLSGMLGSECGIEFIGGQCAHLACAADGCTDPGQECKVSECDLTQGVCVLANEANNVPCDANNPCLEDTTCQEGQCEGELIECSLGDGVDSGCAEALCDPLWGCIVDPAADGTPCDDGNPCTTEDACDQTSACVGTPVSCDDDVPCTSDSCAADGACVHVPKDDACDDQLSCTVDVCTENDCVYSPNDDACDDNDPCTSDLCSASQGCLNTEIPDCVIQVDAALCKDGTEPDEVIAITVTNASADQGVAGWDFTSGFFASYSGQGQCQLPLPAEGQHAWLLGEVCDAGGPGSNTSHKAAIELNLSQTAKEILLAGNGQVRVRALAGTAYSQTELATYVYVTDLSGNVQALKTTPVQAGPGATDWTEIGGAVPVSAEQLNGIQVGFEAQGSNTPVGGWFDHITAQVLRCD